MELATDPIDARLRTLEDLIDDRRRAQGTYKPRRPIPGDDIDRARRWLPQVRAALHQRSTK